MVPLQTLVASAVPSAPGCTAPGLQLQSTIDAGAIRRSIATISTGPDRPDFIARLLIWNVREPIDAVLEHGLHHPQALV
jgi:hypothetical protein